MDLKVEQEARAISVLEQAIAGAYDISETCRGAKVYGSQKSA